MAGDHLIRHHLHQTLEAFAEGWQALRRRASQAITHFETDQAAKDAASAEERLAFDAARWAILAAELTEDEANISLHIEAPGMDPERFEIEVVDDHLIIRGEKRVETQQAGGRYFLLERAYGFFERSFHLPAAVDQTKARADYRRGVLTVTLPKTSAQKSCRIRVTNV